VEFFTWLESTAISIWVRESTSIAFGFPGILTLHAIGMGFLVGICFAIDLRLLGFAPRVPLSAMARFFPVMWFGFVVNAFSGLLLLVGYPTKALTNPVFYLKLAFIGAGTVLAIRLARTAVRNPAFETRPATTRVRAWALLSLFAWVGAIFAGRLLAYTYSRLMMDSL
jgi:hypothetical protein